MLEATSGRPIFNEDERHITEVLAPQGHVLLCTSRPAGIDDTRFASFRRLHLAPLTKEQQREALMQRLGAERTGALLPYLERMPNDAETKVSATSNPLMLSMVASVYEIRQGVGMPETIAELYEGASDAMLARGGVVRLVRAVGVAAQPAVEALALAPAIHVQSACNQRTVSPHSACNQHEGPR